QVAIEVSGLPPDEQEVLADPAAYIALAVLAAVWVFLLGLVALVLLEHLLPTGTVPTPRSLIALWRTGRRRTRRYLTITSIAVKHGLGGYLRGRRRTAPREGLTHTARALRAALSEAGVVFVKF